MREPVLGQIKIMENFAMEMARKQEYILHLEEVVGAVRVWQKEFDYRALDNAMVKLDAYLLRSK